MRLFERFSNTVYLFCDGMEKSQAQQAPFFILPSLIDFGSSVLQRKQKAASVIKGLSGLSKWTVGFLFLCHRHSRKVRTAQKAIGTRLATQKKAEQTSRNRYEYKIANFMNGIVL